MGAQKSIHARNGRFLLEFSSPSCKRMDFYKEKLAILLTLVSCFRFCFVRLSIKHPNLLGRNEKLDVLWDKGIDDFNILIAFRRPKPDWLSPQSFTIQVHVSC
ncbi:hypothetical protein BHE74_00006665 [Ensete ventricosum]|uniref:Uncharacterized protein n=1 Tax=Ensete ventricosum TaxID=4639 RepID=A0A427AH97_ENSVE|nr:hypothetical protein B296_00007950 [Ensete ventricosum]RWW84712.1 hypothetical protein BHE74_00006665 [Ensete ventricosum]RZS19979.1 hypothetical protein BHM03_00052440 [Ensete ventricosum]